MVAIPSRAQSIQDAKSKGAKICALFPVHFPRELIECFNILPVEVWGPPGQEYNLASKHVQPYICPIIKNVVEFYLSGGMDVVDCAVFPHTCDSIQGLATLFTDMLHWDKPTFVFFYPRTSTSELKQQFLADEIGKVINFLERVSGQPFEQGALESKIKAFEENIHLRKQLIDHKKATGFESVEYWKLIRAGEYMFVEEHNKLLAAYLDYLKKNADKRDQKRAVFITGYVPEPMEVFEIIEKRGFYIVEDDYAALGRRLVRSFKYNADISPIENLVRKCLSFNPCPMFSQNVNDRLKYLTELFQYSDAKGVIIHTVKFCEPELFDVPFIEKHFKAMGVPVLFIDTNLEKKLLPRDRNRLEAFLESV